jgi:putative tricarboxylic transport membrane protein
VKLLEIPKPLLYSGILVFATLGVYSLSDSAIDLLVIYAIGIFCLCAGTTSRWGR